MASTSAADWEPVASIASGAHPASTFPNSHLLAPVAPMRPVGLLSPAAWSRAQKSSPLQELRKAVQEEDWERDYEEGFTKIHMRPEWSASADRCATLQWLAVSSGARRALEIGSFCGAGALAMAEALPAGGEVRVLELDPFVVDFGRRFQLKSLSGGKIKSTVGQAKLTLPQLAQEVTSGRADPFDLVVVDADKDSMQQYFDLLWSTPGFLSTGAVVCVDMTPFKGQAPLRYVKYGFPHRWESSSGQEHISALRSAVRESPDFLAHEFGRLLIVQRA